MSQDIISADIVRTDAGRQYHIGVAPEEIAEYILLCGDPARAKRTAALFDTVEHELANREYVTFTGTYEGCPISVMATGIGCDNTEIALVEVSQLVERPTFIRVGSSGALQKEIDLGEFVISTAAVRLENTSTYFVREGYPAVAHYEVVNALIAAADELELPFHVGITGSASGFYGAQARKVPGYPVRFPDIPDELARCGVKNLEMESSTLFSLTAMRDFRAGTICAIYANRPKGTFISAEDKRAAELSCIKSGLKAVTILHQIDAIKRENDWAHMRFTL